MRWLRIATILAIPVLAASCVHVHTDPIEVKPITLNVNINLKIDKELDDVFAFQNKDAATTTPAAAPTTPAVPQ